MSEVNHVELRGTISVRKSYPAREGKKAFVLASIRVEKGFFELRAWEQAAHDLGNADGLTATVVGRLGKEKPKDENDKNWPVIVVVDRVQEHAPRSVNVDAPKAPDEDNIPF